MSVSGGGDRRSRNRHRAPRQVRLRLERPGAISGSSGVLRVDVPSSGRLTASGVGLRRTSTSARRSGSYSIPLKLSPAARRSLGERGSYRTQVRIEFVPASGPPSTTVLRLHFEA